MTTTRDNQDLDDAFSGVMRPLPKPKKKRKAKGRTAPLELDRVRSQAFRVLGLLSGFPATHRTKILQTALRLNRA